MEEPANGNRPRNVTQPRKAAFAETPAEREELPIALPMVPQALPSAPFPWLMMLAPAVLGAGLVVMTGSAHALLFAALGPVLALGTVIDNSAQRRKRMRADDERFEEELAQSTALVEERLERERARRLAATPTVRRIIDGEFVPLIREPPASGAPLPVAVGTTTVPSGVRIDSPGALDDRRLAALLHDGRQLHGMPLVLNVRSVAVSGAAPLALRASLGIVVSVATHVPSGIDLEIAGGVGGRALMAELLRSGLHRAGAVRLRRADDGEHATRPSLRLTLVNHLAEAPAHADVVIDALDERHGVALARGDSTRVRPQLVDPETFRAWAAKHLEHRRLQGVGDDVAAALPDACSLSELLRAAPPPHARLHGAHLAAPLGIGSGGVEWLDLVADGPHAIVGGTTGTGKSELLRAWIAGLASRYPATFVSFLCIDFKGGATFDAIAELPHCVGVVTDLDGGEAVRVLAGLRAELRRREHELRALGARDIDGLEPGQMGRLVVIVDEFQALLDEHLELHDAFVDLAARGRSLGMHLILCAQRPSGSARDSLLANCAIRVSLRVTSAADSHAVLGMADAAQLPATQRGRALIGTGGPPRRIQVAQLDDALLERTSVRRARELEAHGRPAPRAPWLPPLPRRLEGEQAMALLGPPGPARVAIALMDDPEHQAQPRFELDLRGGSHLLVLGPARSGRTTALAAIAEGAAAAGSAVVVVPRDVEGAWDALEGVRRRQGREALVVLVDNLDECGALFSDEHRMAWFSHLADLARLGGARALTLVASAGRVAGETSAFLGLARDVLRLGSPSRHEFVLSGGETSEYRPGLPAGRGVLRGQLTHVRLPEQWHPELAATRTSAPESAPPLELPALVATQELALVTRRPLARGLELEALGLSVRAVPRPGAPDAAPGLGGITVGEPDAWQQSYGALGRAASRGLVVLDDVPPALVRSLLPGEGLPPPLADPSTTVLLRHVDGRFTRALWPAPRE